MLACQRLVRTAGLLTLPELSVTSPISCNSSWDCALQVALMERIKLQLSGCTPDLQVLQDWYDNTVIQMIGDLGQHTAAWIEECQGPQLVQSEVYASNSFVQHIQQHVRCLSNV